MLPRCWSDLAGFVAVMRGLPTGLPEHCTTDEGPWFGQFRAFYRLGWEHHPGATVPTTLAALDLE